VSLGERNETGLNYIQKS